MNGKYDEIINMPHHVSSRHKQMTRHERATQFAPFAALSGYGDSISDASKIPFEKISVDETAKSELDLKLNIIYGNISSSPAVTVTYFKSSENGTDGTYVSVTGNIKRVDEYERKIIMSNGEKIPMNDILSFDGEIFKELN